jgi:hypothetical protein
MVSGASGAGRKRSMMSLISSRNALEERLLREILSQPVRFADENGTTIAHPSSYLS